MAILSISQYGATTTNAPGNTSTTKNSSGIYNIGTNDHQTTTLMKGFNSTADNLKNLYKADGTLKEYIKLIDTSTGKEYNSDGTEKGRTAISYVKISDGGTLSWFGTHTGYVGTSTSYPVSIKSGLFQVHIGNHYASGTSGGAFKKVSFRPVIWN